MQQVDLSLLQKAGALLNTPEMRKGKNWFAEGFMVGLMAGCVTFSIIFLLFYY